MISNHSLEINRFKFSVVVPTYNEEKNIYKLIEALLSQKLLPDEIIISDGGSVDKTLDIVLNFIKKNDKIKILNRNGKCRGSGRNEGIFYSPRREEDIYADLCLLRRSINSTTPNNSA